MFDTDDQSDSNTNQEENKSPLEDRLKEIVNEQGLPKYDSVDKALEALKASQEFIPTLKSENATLREKLEALEKEVKARSSVEETLSKVLEAKDSDNHDKKATTEEHEDEDLETVVDRLLEERLTKKQLLEKKEANKNKVASYFKEAFGDAASQEFKSLANSVGYSQERLEELSAENPELVLRLVKAEKGSTTKTVNTSSINTSGFGGKESVNKLERSPKSVLAGASSKDMAAEMRRHKEFIMKKYNITE